MGEKVAIVTHKPQTTRNRIQGMINLEPKKGRAAGQIVLIDTPGVHRPDSRLGRTMMQQVMHIPLYTKNAIMAKRDFVKDLDVSPQSEWQLVKPWANVYLEGKKS